MMRDEGAIRGYRSDSLKNIKMLCDGLSFIAEINERTVGFATARILKQSANAVIPKAHNICEIFDIFVIKSMRNRAIGSQLISAVLAESHRRRVTVQYLYSSSRDLESILKFYGRHGFKGWYLTMYRQS